LRHLILTELHNNVSAGYLAPAKTLERVRARFYWCGMRRDVNHWCQTCDQRACRTRPAKSPKAPMQQYNVGAPMERVAIGITGPLPLTCEGRRYILVISDYFTKWCDAYPLPNSCKGCC